VGTVGFGDDESRRYVVRRYAFDPSRHERRHIVIAVLDSRREFEKLIDRLDEDLRRRRAADRNVDPREHISGHAMEPGHLARAANGHLLRRAIEHGVYPYGLKGLALPGNMAVFGVGH